MTNSGSSATKIIKEIVVKAIKEEKSEQSENTLSFPYDIHSNNNAKAIRKAHHMTQTELAEILGMTKQGLCFNEVGHISFKTAKAIADYYEVNIIEVMGLDAFQVLPSSEEERAYLINLLQSINLDKGGEQL